MQTTIVATPTMSTRRAGVFGMVGASIMFSLMGGLIRYADHLDSSVLSLSRFVVGIACIAVGVWGGAGSLTFVNRRLLILRGLLGGVGVVIFYMSILHIGLAKGTVISYSYPIFAAVIGVWALGEHLTSRNICAIAVAFVGLIFTMIGAGGAGVWAFGAMDLLALFGAVVAGMVVVIIRKLRETDSTSSIFMAQCAVGMVLVIGPASHGGWDIGIEGWVVLGGVGLFAAAGQLLMTHSYAFLPVAQGSLLCMLTPVFNLLIGVGLFHETLTIVNITGMLLVIGGSVSLGQGPRAGGRTG